MNNRTGRFTFNPDQIFLRDSLWIELKDLHVKLHSEVSKESSVLGRKAKPETSTVQAEGFQPVIPLRDRFKISDSDIFNRYCVAKNWKMDKVKDQFLRNSRWRVEENVNAVGNRAWSKELLDLELGVFGKDKDGQPVYYDRPDPQAIVHMLRTCSMEECLQWHVAVVEAVRGLQHEVGAERFSAVIDLAKVNIGIIRHPSVLACFRDSSLIDQKYYPENLDRLYCVNPPTTVKAIWKVMSVFVDENTKRKINFVSRREEANRQLGLTDDNIPPSFGGTAEGDLLKVPEIMSHLDAAHSASTPDFGWGKENTLHSL